MSRAKELQLYCEQAFFQVFEEKIIYADPHSIM